MLIKILIYNYCRNPLFLLFSWVAGFPDFCLSKAYRPISMKSRRIGCAREVRPNTLKLLYEMFIWAVIELVFYFYLLSNWCSVLCIPHDIIPQFARFVKKI